MNRGPRSPATQAIFAFIQASAPVTQDALVNRFRAEANAAGMSASSWLARRMANMIDAGFVAHGPAGWTALDPGASKPKRDEEAPVRRRKKAAPVLTTSVAQPRRIGMFGGVYVPPAQLHRAGADDYAAAPSVINGQPRAYRRAW